MGHQNNNFIAFTLNKAYNRNFSYNIIARERERFQRDYRHLLPNEVAENDYITCAKEHSSQVKLFL